MKANGCLVDLAGTGDPPSKVRLVVVLSLKMFRPQLKPGVYWVKPAIKLSGWDQPEVWDCETEISSR